MKSFTTISKRLTQPILKLVAKKGRLDLPCIPSSSAALLAEELHKSTGRSILCITDSPPSLAQLHSDLQMLAGTSSDILYFPAAHRIAEGSKAHPSVSEDMTVAGHRLTTLTQLATTSSPVIAVASIQALMQKLPSPERLTRATILLTKGSSCDRDELATSLLNAQYEFTEEVLSQGQACIRGGIIDIWPAVAAWPVRLEVLGSEIESIRSFDPADQRSKGTLTSVSIPPPSETASFATHCSDTFFSYLPDELIVIWLNESGICEHAEMFESTSADTFPLLSMQSIRRRISGRDGTFQLVMDDEDNDALIDILPSKTILGITPSSQHADAFEETRRLASERITSLIVDGYSVVLSCSSEASASHFFSKELVDDPTAEIHIGAISSGFGSTNERFLVVSENDLLPAKGLSALRYEPFGGEESAASRSGFRPAEITDLEPEDLVVHADHGIGIYKGINEISVGGQLQEVLSIEYAGSAILHVPVSQAHLLSRYVGLPQHRARLHKLGGKKWKRDKDEASESIMDMAASLLELQAHRAVQPGHAFPADKAWQRDFEASFEHTETQDQIKAITAVKADMEAPHPMDRLICGDAGYGKTEVAMRGAFKAVMDSKQVVLLVPTTILAQQHFDTFSQRMSIFPVKIAMLSRFCSRAERNKILEGLSEGTIDIVIGTHALLQQGVNIKDLGLVIIDEEQRFGVEHKERLKQMRKLVDVLTMTATPIPRTLYLSMTGAREMSLIQTPPSERLPVKTVVTKNTDATIRTAIKNELHREGQVFYLHNRILTIQRVHERLSKLLPEASIAIAHGRMPAHELSEVMHEFARGDLDVLLCTTIIESGLDIPRANTILIDRADRFGIADLYQLRGRVGRSTRKAYAYLLLPEHGHVDSDARSRIGAVKTFSGLAAGFNLALRDMEIRGVGNILGAQQSGHISAIGFGLYCQLLKRTVSQLKGEKVSPALTCVIKLDFISFTFADSQSTVAAIPYTYVEEERIRLGLYRKVAEIATRKDIKELQAEMIDRFGPIDPAVKRLLSISMLRIICAEKGVTEIEVKGDKLMIMRDRVYIKADRLFPKLTNSSPDKRLAEIVRAVRKL